VQSELISQSESVVQLLLKLVVAPSDDVLATYHVLMKIILPHQTLNDLLSHTHTHTDMETQVQLSTQLKD